MTYSNHTNRKHVLDGVQPDGADLKRQRIAIQPQAVPPQAAQLQALPQIQITPLGPGPHSLAEVFTLTTHDGIKTFDVSTLPLALTAKVSVTTMAKIDPIAVTKAVEGVRSRLLALASAAAPEINPNTAPLGIDDDEDDYEPDYYAAEDTEQILNKLDSAPSEQVMPAEDYTLGLKSFRLPEPPPLDERISLGVGAQTAHHLLDIMRGQAADSVTKKPKTGFTRLAASSYDIESWTTVISRLAARTSVPMDEAPVKEETEETEETGQNAVILRSPLSNSIREALYAYVLEDFRRRIDVAVSWLCEEWYNDNLLRSKSERADFHYEVWALKLIDGFFPYLNGQDKVLVRFLSEIPDVNGEILSRVRQMCQDPSVVSLAIRSLLYLAMMKPPAREAALDTLQDMWTECKFSNTAFC